MRSKLNRFLGIVMLAALLLLSSSNLYANIGARLPGTQVFASQTVFGPGALSAEAGRSVPEAGETDEGSDIKKGQAEINQGHAYPGTTTPPLAIDKALDWTQKYVPAGLPQGAANKPLTPSAAPLTLAGSNWTSLGPTPLNSGTGFDGNFRYGNVSGRISALAQKPDNPAIVYAGSASGGIWQTSNCCSSGTKWKEVSDNPSVSTSVIGAFAIDPTATKIVYAGTGDSQNPNTGTPNISLHSRGVLKSTDEGATWVTLGQAVFGGGSDGMPTRILTMAVNKNHSQTVLAGTDSGNPDKAGLYASQDGGNTWTHCLITGVSTKQVVTDIIIDASISPSKLYVALGDEVGNPLNGVYTALLSSPTGCPSSWASSLQRGSGDGQWGRIQLAIAPGNAKDLYAAMVEQPPAPAEAIVNLYTTTDRGSSWHTTSTRPVFQDCKGPNSTAQAWYDLVIKVDPSNVQTIYLGIVDLYKSTDAGATFTNLSEVYGVDGTSACPKYGTMHPDQHALLVSALSGATQVVVGNDGGAYVSADSGNSFTEMNDTLSDTQFYDGDVTPNFATDYNANLFGGLQDNGNANFSAARLGPWTMPTGGDGFYTAIEPQSRNDWYAEYTFGRLKCSTGGAGGPFNLCPGAWGHIDPLHGNWVSDQPTLFSTPFILDHHNCSTTCQHLVLGTNQVWESTNGGLSGADWHQISSFATSAPIRALAFAPSATTVVYAGTTDGMVQYTRSALIGPTSWYDLTDHGPGGMPNRQVSDIAVSPTVVGSTLTAYVAFDGFDENTPTLPGHLYAVSCRDTNCQGANRTWTNVSGNLPDIPVYSVAVNPLIPAQVFVGTEIGVYYTDNINSSYVFWNRFQTGMPVTPVFRFTIDNGNTALVAWTYGRGAYAVLLPQSTQLGSWNLVASPSVDTQDILRGVAWLNPNNAWAVGDYNSSSTNLETTLTLQWNGSSWSRVPSPSPAGLNSFLWGVGAIPASTAVWAVGNDGAQTLILKWNGASWQTVASPTPGSSGQLHAVAAQSPTDAWAVGYYYNGLHTQTLILHWDGSNWNTSPSPNPPGANFSTLSSVVALSASDAWAVGWSDNHTLTMHWDGTAWSIQTSPTPPSSTASYLNSVTTQGSGVWAVGYYTVGNNSHTLTMHWNGASWDIVSSPDAPGAQSSILYGVSGVAGGDLWAVGFSYPPVGPYRTLIVHWDGAAWQVVSSPNQDSSANVLLAVSTGSGADAWAVGDYVGSSALQTLTMRYGPPSARQLESAAYLPVCSSVEQANRGYNCPLGLLVI